MLTEKEISHIIERFKENFEWLFPRNIDIYFDSLPDEQSMNASLDYAYGNPKITIDLWKQEDKVTFCKHFLHEVLHTLRPEEDVKLSLCENKETYRMLEERMTCRMTNILFNLLDMEQFIETLEEK